MLGVLETSVDDIKKTHIIIQSVSKEPEEILSPSPLSAVTGQKYKAESQMITPGNDSAYY